VISPALLFFAEYSLCYLQPFVFPNELYGRFFYLCDEFYWDVDGNCIEHADCFWQYNTFYYVDSANL
jgi:hypothetical protein